MRKSIWMLAAAGMLLIVLSSGCAQAAATTPAPTEEPTEAEATETATKTITPTATKTSTPTKTPSPTKTATPRPTRTPSLTPTQIVVATRKPTNTPDPNATPSATAGPTGEATATTQAVSEFVPTGTSVWQLDNSAYETGQSAECPAPVQHDFYGLYAVTTVEGGITWRGQDGITYTLVRQNPNVFFGGGASVLPGYNVAITAVFGSATAVNVNFVLSDQNVAGCTHYYKYNGTFQFMR